MPVAEIFRIRLESRSSTYSDLSRSFTAMADGRSKVASVTGPFKLPLTPVPAIVLTSPKFKINLKGYTRGHDFFIFYLFILVQK